MTPLNAPSTSHTRARACFLATIPQSPCAFMITSSFSPRSFTRYAPNPTP
jgi:hypothetical protein